MYGFIQFEVAFGSTIKKHETQRDAKGIYTAGFTTYNSSECLE